MIKLIVTLSLVALAMGVPFKGFPRNNGRIVGGEEADITDFPYQVSLRLFDEHTCGGAILNENTIVTAAHCLAGFLAHHLSVMVGSDEVNGGVFHKLDRIIEHPLYNEDNSDYDIGILKLATPIKFNSKASPIALQDYEDDVSAGTVGTVSGWGVISENDEDTPEHLRKVDVDVISDEDCKAAFISKDKITPRMLCAMRSGKDSCQGDSGGPLVANKKLIGVVSWGIGCARPHYPGIYSKVSNLRQWIDQNK